MSPKKVLPTYCLCRETHKMMLDHYQQTKNLLVSYSENKLGFF